MFKKCCSILMSVMLVLGSILPVSAQSVVLPQTTDMMSLSLAYTPCLLRGIKLDKTNPFQMSFIVDPADSGLSDEALSAQTQTLVRYFLASLTIPEKDMWVNLSPYENNRIIEEHFGQTQMGRDLLALDYVLKQLTSSLMHPETDLGKKFWGEIYRRSFEQYGTTDIPIDVFNKVWITPKHALVYEDQINEERHMTALIHQATLKVMLESDYLASLQEKKVDDLKDIDATNKQMAQDVIRSVILPVLEQEVNEGRHFSVLRQIYHSLLLATWFKKRLSTAEIKTPSDGIIKAHPLSVMFMDQQKTQGVDIQNPENEKQYIYDQYLKAFKQGAYDLIKEEMDVYSQEMIPRKYFSGGAVLETSTTTDYAQMPEGIGHTLKKGLLIASVALSVMTSYAGPEGDFIRKKGIGQFQTSMEVAQSYAKGDIVQLNMNEMNTLGPLVFSSQGGVNRYTQPFIQDALALLQLYAEQNSLSKKLQINSAIRDQRKQKTLPGPIVARGGESAHTSKELIGALDFARVNARVAQDLVSFFSSAKKYLQTYGITIISIIDEKDQNCVHVSFSVDSSKRSNLYSMLVKKTSVSASQKGEAFALTQQTEDIISSAALKIKRLDPVVSPELIKERFSKERNGQPGLNIQEIFDKVEARYAKDPSLQAVWGTSQALKEAVIMIAYLESSFGFLSDDYWQVKPALRTEIENRRALFDDIKLGDKNTRAYHYDFALANIYWLSDLIKRFYPDLTPEEKQVLVIMGYNHGQAVIREAKGIDLLLGVTTHGKRLMDQSKLKGKPYQNNDEQSFLYGAKYETFFGRDTQWKVRDHVLKRSGYPVPSKEFSVLNVAPKAFERYLKEGQKGLSSDLERPSGHIVLLENPLIDRAIWIAKPKSLDAEGNDQGTIAGAFDLSRDQYPIKSLTAQIRRKNYSNALSLEEQVRRVLLLNGIVPPKEMTGMAFETSMNLALKRNSFIYYPHPEEMNNPTPLFEDILLDVVAAQPNLIENYPYLSVSWLQRIQDISFYNNWDLKEEIKKRIPFVAQEKAIEYLSSRSTLSPQEENLLTLLRSLSQERLTRGSSVDQQQIQQEQSVSSSIQEQEIKTSNIAEQESFASKIKQWWQSRSSKKKEKTNIPLELNVVEKPQPSLALVNVPAPLVVRGKISIDDFNILSGWSVEAKARLWTKLVKAGFIIETNEGSFVKEGDLIFSSGFFNNNVTLQSRRNILTILKDVQQRTTLLEPENQTRDPAFLTQSEVVGGIDLNTQNLEMIIYNNQGAFEFEIDQQQLLFLKQQILGLTPTIQSIEPFSSPKFLE